MKQCSECLRLFLCFFKIGAFTFGGGYAMIPLIERETAENNHWVTREDILNIIAIAESTPGAISINSATFIGFRVAGVLGALFATIGLVLPSFIIISILSLFIVEYQHLQWVSWLFDGIRAGVIVLIFNAVLKMKKGCPNNIFSIGLMVFTFIGASFLELDVILLLIIAAALGILYQLYAARKRLGKEGDLHD